MTIQNAFYSDMLLLLVPYYIGNCDSSEYFICNNGECVDRYARCNSINDCIDGEDERDCNEWRKY